MNELTTTSGGRELDDYDPHKGLMNIAVAEAAENMYARAKDAIKLYEAIEAKLGEQRKFVLWWDKQEKRRATPGNLGPSQTTDAPAARDFGLDRDTLHRWRKRLTDPKKFDAELEKANGRCIKITEFQQGGGNTRSVNTGEVEWYTPAEYIETVRDVLGQIDIDPASSKAAQETVQAKKYYDIEANGLDQEWNGRVWLNPPYSQPDIGDFVTKLIIEWSAGRTEAAIMLTNNSTDTTWFHEAASIADAICFTRGRIKFKSMHRTEGSPTQGQAFFYFGPDRAGFSKRFAEVGFVMRSA